MTCGVEVYDGGSFRRVVDGHVCYRGFLIFPLVCIVQGWHLGFDMVYFGLFDELEGFVKWLVFCWRCDRGIVVGMLVRVEWLYVRRWEQSVFMLVHERGFERLVRLVDRLMRYVDGFIKDSCSVSLVVVMDKFVMDRVKEGGSTIW